MECEGEEQVKQAVVVLKGMTWTISWLPIDLLGVCECVLDSDKHTHTALICHTLIKHSHRGSKQR